MFTQAIKGVLIWMGIPPITVDQLIGYREERCVCGDETCQGVKGVIHLELHVLKKKDGTMAACPVEKKSRILSG